MGIMDLFRGKAATPASSGRAEVMASGAGYVSLDDPRLIEFLRDGMMTATGFTVNPETALRNPSMFRACSLISNSIGMLPLQLLVQETKQKAKDHSLYRVLHRRPNGFQSAFDFRASMQMRALVHRNAFARVVKSTDLRTGKPKIIGLVPLDSRRMTVSLNASWRMEYLYEPPNGPKVRYQAEDIFHLRGASLDGLNGFSLIEQAKEAIGLALSAELAAGRMFKNGTLVGGALSHKGTLSDDAFDRLKQSLAEKEGADNAGKNLILEEGMEWKAYGSNAKDSQMTELRKLQIEEIARVSGVPRPLLMVDETSWGSGIEALGQFFVAYALNPWFEAWQQAIERCLLDEDEAEIYEAKFNPGALLRGSLKEQGEYLSKALGSGGHQPWMHYDEARSTMDLPAREKPINPMMNHNGGPPLEEDPSTPKPKQKPAPKQDDEDDE
ncbi:phage portal protein [Rhizobium sp. 9140]|uniref:phage portal protein n=1 Tax=Rhizobium sp. 9140 TaxID=1761900 RepID=UPI00079B7CAE|nr:phage portal protein [Rhizobium sp. 9140]CZT36145.1 phage portal protein, HK97 family [Rhizobium sp. 9140]